MNILNSTPEYARLTPPPDYLRLAPPLDTALPRPDFDRWAASVRRQMLEALQRRESI